MGSELKLFKNPFVGNQGVQPLPDPSIFFGENMLKDGYRLSLQSSRLSSAR